MSATGFSHLDLWYQTRFSPHIEETSAVNNPCTELNEVPTRATVKYLDFGTREVTPEKFEGRCQHPKQVSDFLIQRAMLDADAKVVPK